MVPSSDNPSAALRSLAAAFKDAGIPAWILSGDPVTLLVTQHRWDHCLKKLRAMGARGEGEPDWRWRFHFAGASLEVRGELLPGRDLEGLVRSESRPCRRPGLSWFRELSPELRFVCRSGEGVLWPEQGDRWLRDLDGLVRREPLDWPALVRLAESLGLERALATARALLQRQFSSPVPRRLPGMGLAEHWLGRLIALFRPSFRAEPG